MDIRRKIIRQKDRKIKEIEGLKKEIESIESSIKQAEAYLQAIEDTLKHIPKESKGSEESAIREGSAVDKARKAIKNAGKALHIGDVLKEMGELPSKENRQTLASQLSHYVRQERVFTRPSPNTFGLTEWHNSTVSAEQDESEDQDNDEIPTNFGAIHSID